MGHAPAPGPQPALPRDAPIERQLAVALEALKLWTGFAVEEAARVDQADGRTRDAIGIVRRCEERDAAAIRRARPKLLGIF